MGPADHEPSVKSGNATRALRTAYDVADLQVPKADTYCGSTYWFAIRQKNRPRVLGSPKPITLFGMVFQKKTWCRPLRAPARKKNYSSEATEVLKVQSGIDKVLPLELWIESQLQNNSAPAHLVHVSPEK